MRIAAAAIAGYLFYFLWVAVTYSALWIVTGSWFAYVPGTTLVTPAWLLAATPLNLAGAMFAGWIACRIARRDNRGVVALALLVVFLGLAVAVANIRTNRDLPSGKNPATLSAQEAGRYSVQPVWYEFTIPLLGAFSVMLGGYRREEDEITDAVTA